MYVEEHMQTERQKTNRNGLSVMGYNDDLSYLRPKEGVS